jgi:hypothetical protein
MAYQDVLPGAVGAYGYQNLMGKLDDQRKSTMADLSSLQSGVDEKTQFQPWSITSSLGKYGQDAQGNTQMQLSPQQQYLQNQMFHGGSTLMGQAFTGAQDTGAREQEIYDRIRAMQTPGEERGYNQMNQAALRQGRTGMGTAEYGGSPEQLAFAKAQAEARNTASFGSMGQAQEEIGNQFKWGSGMLNQGYVPQQQMLEQGAFGLQGKELQQNSQMNNANLFAQLGMQGITADTNYSNIEGNAFGNLIKALSSAAGGVGTGIDNAGGLIEMLKNLKLPF